MKTTISVPDDVFDAAERVAGRLGMSRSQLYSTAVRQFVDAHRSERVTERLNEVYADEPLDLDAVLAAIRYVSTKGAE
jgi:metal-responsive CopG/Arc/MetJ family transcriptional regulator